MVDLTTVTIVMTEKLREKEEKMYVNQEGVSQVCVLLKYYDNNA